MSYDTERVKVGRVPATLIEIDLDKCANTYGTSPCTASLSAGSECYNCRAHCQDPDNYVNTDILTHKFSDRDIQGEPYIPCVKKSKLIPVTITPGQPFNRRASITITIQDFPHHDRGIDPYVNTRSYTPNEQGSYFGKLLARNPYYTGRPLRLMTGYIGDTFSTGDFKTQNFIIEKMNLSAKGVVTIVAKDILKLADDERALCPFVSDGKLEAGITSGATSLTVTSGTEDDYLDVNILGDDTFNTGEWTEGAGWSVDGGIATSVSGSSSEIHKPVYIEELATYVVTFTVSNRTSGSVTPRFGGGTTVNGTARSADGTYTETMVTVVGNETFKLGASVTFAGDVSVISVRRIEEYIRIGDEVIYAPYTNRAANVFSNLTRASWNTTAESHDVDESVQVCKYFNFTNVVDVVNELMVNHALIDPSYIPRTDWDIEKETWLIGSNLTALITEPTGVKTLLDELSEQLMVYFWWDAFNQEIPLKAIAPRAPATITLDEDSNIIGDATVKTVQEDRKSRVLVYYNPRNPVNFSDPTDFIGVYGLVDLDEESRDKYNDKRLKIIYSRWITSDGVAIQTGSRTRNQFRNPPRIVEFLMDAKDSDNETGDFVNINTRQIQDADGSNLQLLTQIIRAEEVTRKVPGTFYKYSAQVTQFTGRYAQIMAPGATSVYSSASDAEKVKGCYIVSAGARVFSDGQEAYKIP